MGRPSKAAMVLLEGSVEVLRLELRTVQEERALVAAHMTALARRVKLAVDAGYDPRRLLQEMERIAWHEARRAERSA